MRPPCLRLASALLLLAGCARPEPPAAPAAVPAAAPAAAGQVVEITVGDAMKYDVTRIEAAAGKPLTVVLHSAATLPREAMAHNFVLLQKDTDVMDFMQAAASSTPAAGYIPTELAAQVLAHTRLLGPHESDTITFTVPSVPGEYNYLCTFPGHFLSGMKGVLVVK